MVKNQALIHDFLQYVQIDTQSDERSESFPSTKKQFSLAEKLVSELMQYGVEVDYDEIYCYIYAVLEDNTNGKNKKNPIGFIAHMDTSSECSGENVQPRYIEAYNGEDELLKTEEFPELLNHIGEDLIATDGRTLLGADDKAGIAEIMNMVRYFTTHPEVKHRKIAIAFTPDEEIGSGTEHFDIKRFGASEAYTVDGGKLGVLEYECFNAAAAYVTVKGRSTHPGTAKNALRSAMKIAMEFHHMLPQQEAPEFTEGYEGFYHLTQFEGTVEKASMEYILRDFTQEGLQKKKETLRRITDYLTEKYGEFTVLCSIEDQYRNMLEIMKDHMDLIEDAVACLKELGVTAVTEPIRGGTDGAALSFMGIPCPNLCTGGYNYHSRYEYASVQEMEQTAELLILLGQLCSD